MLNLSNDLTTIFKLNTANKVKARTPSKSESWKESSENNMNINILTNEDDDKQLDSSNHISYQFPSL